MQTKLRKKKGTKKKALCKDEHLEYLKITYLTNLRTQLNTIQIKKKKKNLKNNNKE